MDEKLQLQKLSCGDAIDLCLIVLIIMQVFIFEYFGLARYLNWIVSILACCRIPALLKTAPARFAVLVLLLLLAISLNLIITDSGSLQNAARGNLLLLAYPFIYLSYIFLLCKKKIVLARKFYAICLPTFNLILLANIVVMLVQTNSIGSMIATVPSSGIIDYYPDTISGLFAYGSVHAVALYTTFVIIADLRYAQRVGRQSSVKLFLWLLYLFAISIASVYIALNNDNKAFLLIFPLALCMFILRSALESKNGRDTLVIRLFLMLFVSVFIGLIALSIPAVSKFINDSIFSTVSMAFEGRDLGNRAVGSNERIAIIGYALFLPSTWAFGQGIGASGLYSSDFLGFAHFGQADLGSLLVLFGIWITGLLIFLYSILFSALSEKNDWANPINKIVLIAFVILICLYTQCFSRINCCFCLFLLCTALFADWASSSGEERNNLAASKLNYKEF